MQDRLLVGRDRELRILDDGVAAASRGERAVLMITGEPGIGKTRLLEELVTRVIAAGGFACWGRTWEVGHTPPFSPWAEVLAALETPGDPAPALGGAEEHGDARARLARFAEVVAFLRRRARHAPIALLFDDLHAADPSSLQLLEYALPLLIGQRVLFGLAARDLDASREIETALARLQRGAFRVALSRLGEGDVHTLVAGAADARRVYELSDGNPLFVEELLAAQRTQGLLRLPPLSSVRAVIRDRVARLPEGTRKALLSAAIVGREFRGRVVAEMVDETDARALLEPVVSLGMVVMTGPDRFRFSHALVAEALSEEASGRERAELHLAAARALERNAPENVSAIAHHLLEAGDLAAESAVSAAERAADRCMTQLAFEDAAALYERATHSLAGGSNESKWRRAVLLCGRAEALQHATQHAAAAALCDEAAELVRSLGDSPANDAAALFARVALARGLEFRFGRTDPLLVAILSEAIDRLGNGSLALRAKLLARLAAAEQPSLEPQEPVVRALEAIELARQLEPRDRLGVMYVATAALVDYVDPAELEPIQEEVLRLARGVDRWIAVHTRLRLCFTALVRSSRRDFDLAARTFEAEAEALGLPQWTRYAFMLKALTALLDGRFDDAQSAANRFEAVSGEIGDTGATFMTDVHRAMAAWIRTAPQDPGVRARLSGYAPGRAAIAAWFAYQEGALEPVRLALAELAGRVPTDPDMAAMVASAVAFLGDRDFAQEAYEVLSLRKGSAVLASMVGAAVMDLYDRLLLVLAMTTERWELIDEHATSALAVAAKLGSPVWAARVEADWADALERRARAGDLERARALRRRAASVAERFGMPGLLVRCRGEETKRPALVPAHPSPADARVVCERHGGLWIVTGFGEQIHVKDSRGIEMIARLIEEPGAPLHALDLVGFGEPVDGGDSGPALDAKARSAYRARLAELVAERDDAEGSGDLGRSERATAEIELLGAELERAFGLGGRERRVGAASERARTNVQRRIAHAVEQVRSGSQRLGEHLAASIRTGTYCVYEPRR